MRIGTINVNADAETILNRLISESNYFSLGLRNSGDYFMVQCPYHKDGKERHPSGQFRKKDLWYYCHDFTDVVRHCLNVDGRNWLIENFNGSIEGRETKFDFKKKKDKQYISEDSLKLFNKKHPYMYKRQLTDEVINKFNIGYDDTNNCITFPNRDEYGNILFIATRNIDNKFFHYPKEIDKPVYGLYEVYQEKNVDKVYICESMFNCLTLWSWGYYAVALNGTGSNKQLDILKKSSIRHFVLALDNDFAGNKGYCRIYLHTHRYLGSGLPFWKSVGYEITVEEDDYDETTHMVKNLK